MLVTRAGKKGVAVASPPPSKASANPRAASVCGREAEGGGASVAPLHPAPVIPLTTSATAAYTPLPSGRMVTATRPGPVLVTPARRARPLVQTTGRRAHAAVTVATGPERRPLARTRMVLPRRCVGQTPPIQAASLRALRAAPMERPPVPPTP